jgi:hypothetical protein
VVDCSTGKLMGIAFQGYAGSSVENQGHMVPSPFIHHFLEGVCVHRSAIRLVRLTSPSARSFSVIAWLPERLGTSTSCTFFVSEWLATFLWRGTLVRFYTAPAPTWSTGEWGIGEQIEFGYLFGEVKRGMQMVTFLGLPPASCVQGCGAATRSCRRWACTCSC